MSQGEATGERHLLSAVVALAINDACIQPMKNLDGEATAIDEDARTALAFLFSGSLDAYALWLDFDPEQFRKRLKERMFSDEPSKTFKDTEKRAFRWNFNRMFPQKNRVSQ